MANFDLKTLTPDTSIDVNAYLFGADSQSAASPSVYQVSTLKTLLIGAGSVSIASGKTLTANNTLTLAGTDSTTMTFPSTSTTLAGLSIANSFTTSQNITPSSDVISLALRRNGAAQTSNILEIQTEANAFLSGFDKAGLLTLGAATRQTGILKLAGTTSGVVSLSVADAAGTWTLKLPTTAGTNGYVLSTDGAGVTSWIAQSGGSSTLTVDSTATSGGAAGQIMFDTGSVLSESSSLTWNNTNKLLTATGLGTGGGANTGGLTLSGGSLTFSGNISANAWTTNGIRYKSVAATLTDLTSSGTVAAAYTNVYVGNTIAASSATTFTDYVTTWINAASAGTNVTLTNAWALGLGGNLKLGSDASGSNQAGTNITIGGSRGTGSAAGGSIIFRVSPAGSSGSSLNALATAMTIDSTQLVTFNNSIGLGAPGSVWKLIPNGSTSLVFWDSSNSDAFAVGPYNQGIAVTSAGSIGWSSGLSPTIGGRDTILLRDAANTLALRNGTNAQTFNIYNTYTSATNFERLRIFAQSGDSVIIGTQKGSGGGTARALVLQTDATTALTLTTAQKAEFAATIKTGTPNGGTAAEWKLGSRVAATTTLDTTQYIELDVGGTLYKLAVVTS